MEPIKVNADAFRLLCTYKCCTQDVWDETANNYVDTVYFIGVKPVLQTKSVSFAVDVPDGAAIKSAHVYATLSTTMYGADTCTINGTSVETGGVACVEVDIADGASVVGVPFGFLTNAPLHQHRIGASQQPDSSYWNGDREYENYYFQHEAYLDYTDVYLLIECEDTYTPPEFVPYTDPNPVAGETYVKAVHMTELHENVNRLRIAKGLTAYAFTAITPMQTSLAGWNAHVLEIRAALDEVSTEHDAWLALDVNRPRLDVLLQLRSMVEALTGTTAPAITTEASGAVVTLTDAAARVVQGLVTTIDPTTEGVSAVTLTRTGRNLVSHLDYTITQGNKATIVTEDVIDVTVASGMDYITIPAHLKAGVTYTLCIEQEVYGRDESSTLPTASQFGLVVAPSALIVRAKANGVYKYIQVYTSAADIDTKIRVYANYGNATTGSNGQLAACSRIKVMLVEGEYTKETAPAFEPCRRQTLTTSLPEKVYGGKLDWTSGLLTITHGADGVELSVPRTAQVARQTLEMLKGYNALWSDAGDTAVTYIAGT